jgi:hypothetical protein
LNIIDQLRTDMEGLLTELSGLSRRNDELMAATDSDLVIICDLDIQFKEYKCKYEQAKTELRSVEGTLLAHCNNLSTICLFYFTILKK